MAYGFTGTPGSASQVGVDSFVATFPTEVADAEECFRWRIEPVGLGASVAAVHVQRNSSGVYAVDTHPPMSPGVSYYADVLGDDLVSYAEVGPWAVPSSMVDELPGPPKYRHIARLVNAFALEMSKRTGRWETSLAGPVDSTSKMAYVLSTHRFRKDGGQFFVDGRICTYESANDGAFYGISFDPPLAEIIPAGTVVRRRDTAQPSAEDEPEGMVGALWDTAASTMVHLASGDRLDRLCALYGLPRPYGMPRSSWRYGAWAVALGPKGYPGGVFSFIEGVLGFLSRSIRMSFDPDDIGSAHLPDGDGSNALVRKLVRTSYGLLRIESCSANEAVFTSVGVMGPAGWDRPGSWAGESETRTETCKILPFYIKERNPGPISSEPADVMNGYASFDENGVVQHYFRSDTPDLMDVWHQPGLNRTVELCLWSDAFSPSPPTYMQQTELSLYRDGAGGTGGLWSGSPSAGQCIYFGMPGPFGGVEFKITEPTTLSGTVTWEYWPGRAPWTWVPLMVDDGTEGLTVDGVVSWDAPSQYDWGTGSVGGSDQLRLVRARISSPPTGGGGAVEYVMPVRLGQEPLGGILMENASTPAGDRSPIYLSGSGSRSDIKAALKMVLAAGVFPRVVTVDPPSQDPLPD